MTSTRTYRRFDLHSKVGPLSRLEETNSVYFEDLYDKVKDGLRPSMDDGICSKDICEVIRRCWSDNPNERPDFGLIREGMRKITK